jgi:hypothetical protein
MASGWDLSYQEADMVMCVNEHIICGEHQLDLPELTAQEMYDILVAVYATYGEHWQEERDELAAVEDPEKWDKLWDWYHEYENDFGSAERYCPICQFLEISNADTAAFLLKETSISREEAFAWVKASNKRRKKLYDSEYVMYACMQAQRDISDLPQELKERFGTYKKFKEWLRES